MSTKKQEAPSNWVALMGEWDRRKNNIIFKGKEVEYEGPNGKEKVHAIGHYLCDQLFSDGSISCEIEFSEVSPTTACELILSYDTDTQSSLNAGIGGGGSMFSIRSWDPKGRKWIYHMATGERGNFKNHSKFRLVAKVTGSRVSLLVDNVEVCSITRNSSNLPSHVGLWCCSLNEIEIKNFAVETQKPTAFVVMQFGEPYDELYTDVIKPICKEFEVETVRADERYDPGLIIADIARQIVDSGVVIADITPSNPNVYYEVGYAHALGKPTILIATKGVKLPFDVSPFRTLFYEDSIRGKPHIEEGLRKHLSEIMKAR